ncbi:MAG: NUDIX hydrolase [Oligoflexales bacterium]|nr:NUDIX hydrolase [Oligoflexales bacterium]
MKYYLENKETIIKAPPFTVEKIQVGSSSTAIKHLHPYYRLNCPDWVNILPVTESKEAILIKQLRFGNMKLVLETPGGVIDQKDKCPEDAALRELEEETGYTTNELISLGSINPNPATHTNKIHMFLACNSFLNENRTHFPDGNEDIETTLINYSLLDKMVREGKIDHALSALTILFALKYMEENL